MRRVATLLFVAFMVVGCASTASYKISSERPRASYPPEYGVVAGVFTTPDRWRLDRTAFIRNVETKKDYRISQSFAFHAGDYEHADRKGIVFALALPPGRYEFYNYLIYSANGAFETRWYAKPDFSVPLDVSPGSVTYVGDLQFTPYTGKNLLGMNVADGGHFRIVNSLDQDLPQLRAKFPDVDWSTVELAPLFGRTLPPLLSAPRVEGVDQVVPPAPFVQ